MNTAEIVISEVQGNGGFQVRPFLAECIRQAGKSSARHAKREVLPFNERRADMLGVGIAESNLGYNLRDWAWGVPPFGAIELSMIEQLHKLREIHVQPKAHRHSRRVVNKAVRGELSRRGETLVQVPQECRRIVPRSFAHQERRNEFGFFINRHEDVLIANFRRIGRAHANALLLNVSPDFVYLQVSRLESAHPGIHQTGAALPGHDEQAHDRVAVESGQPFRGSDRAALKKAMQRPFRRVCAGTHRAKGRFGLRFGKGRLAGIAAPALDSTLAVGAEPLAGLVLAFGAGHDFSPLDFCGKKPHTHFGSGVRLTPRFGLAPQPVSAGSGALIVSDVSGWGLDRDNYGLTVSKANLDGEFHAGSILPEGPVAAGLSHFRPQSFLLLGHHSGERTSLPTGNPLNPLVRHANTACVERFRYFLNLSGIFHSLNRGVHRREEISLRRKPQALNGIAHLGGSKRLLGCPQYHSAGIANSFHQAGDRGTVFVGLHKFVQRSDALLLLRHLRFQLGVFRGHEQKIAEGLF